MSLTLSQELIYRSPYFEELYAASQRYLMLFAAQTSLEHPHLRLAIMTVETTPQPSPSLNLMPIRATTILLTTRGRHCTLPGAIMVLDSKGSVRFPISVSLMR